MQNLESLPMCEAVFIEPMECLAVAKLPESPVWIYEIKLDGYRALAINSKGKLSLVSRKRKSFNRQYPYLVEALTDLPDNTVVDGEIVALDDAGRPNFHLLQHSRSQAPRICYFVFDLLIYENRDLTRLSSNKSPRETKKKLTLRRLREFKCSKCNYARYPNTGRCTNDECPKHSRKPGVLTLEQIAHEYAPPPLFHGRKWGQWTFDEERLVLVFRGSPVMRGGEETGCPPYEAFIGRYEIDLEGIGRSSNMLDWIFQVHGKTWATARVMKDFLNAIDDIIRPQATLCSGGSDKIIKNPTEFLKNRIATIGVQKEAA